MLLSNGDVGMLQGDIFSEDFYETRVDISADAEVELNLSPIQQYLVFAMANRDEPDAQDGALPD